MSTPTVIRHARVENSVHMVITYYDRTFGFSAAYQHYTTCLHSNRTSLVEQFTAGDERPAVNQFDERVAEDRRLTALDIQTQLEAM